MRWIAQSACFLLLVHFIPSECRSYYLTDDKYTLEHNHIDKYEHSEDLDMDSNVEDRHEQGQSTYRYEYNINSPQTGDYKSQREERVGNSVRGSYSLIEPDGSKRIVEYTADPHNGFQATVKHEPPSPNMYTALKSNLHHLGISNMSAPENVTPMTRFQHVSLFPAALAPLPITTPKPDSYVKSKRLFYTNPPSFPISTPQSKFKSATSTAPASRYYFNTLARLGAWPFIY